MSTSWLSASWLSRSRRKESDLVAVDGSLHVVQGALEEGRCLGAPPRRQLHVRHEVAARRLATRGLHNRGATMFMTLQTACRGYVEGWEDSRAHSLPQEFPSACSHSCGC